PINNSEKLWSSVDRIAESDFQLKVENMSSNPCFAQFSINYSVSGFDFFTRNFNQKVKNTMYTSASWLDNETPDKERLIRSQQILFDLSEIYARRFRKQLLIDRKKISKGPQIAESINKDIMNDFAEERAAFEKESKGGLLTEVLSKWEEKIKLELADLNEFRFDNTEKIKLEK
ncbi:MAG: hypothetical protein K8F24_02865, partial [Bacteroidales bacterium]|nr:hypothetical protein [Bacteroidales bacterium]